jgi:opacity protein-like surface antigen
MKKVLVCASLIALSASAFASDTSSSVYLRGDVAASKANTAEKTSTGESRNLDWHKPVYSAGVGYKFDNNFRADVNAQLRNSSKKNVTAEYKSKTVFLNGYYDFDSSSIFTPYVTVGAGYTQNTMDKLATGTESVKSKNFVYNAGFGSKINVAKDVDLDLGYRFVGLGKFKSKNASGITTTTKTHAQELSAGVIFSF